MVLKNKLKKYIFGLLLIFIIIIAISIFPAEYEGEVNKLNLIPEVGYLFPKTPLIGKAKYKVSHEKIRDKFTILIYTKMSESDFKNFVRQLDPKAIIYKPDDQDRLTYLCKEIQLEDIFKASKNDLYCNGIGLNALFFKCYYSESTQAVLFRGVQEKYSD